jgi:hypothetical protein
VIVPLLPARGGGARRRAGCRRACSGSTPEQYRQVVIYCETLLVLAHSLLKELTNEKRGGLTVVSFDRSRFKMMWTVCRSPILCRYLETTDFKWQKQGRWVILGLSQEGACTDLFKNISARPIECYHVQPTYFLNGQYTFKEHRVAKSTA